MTDPSDPDGYAAMVATEVPGNDEWQARAPPQRREGGPVPGSEVPATIVAHATGVYASGVARVYIAELTAGDRDEFLAAMRSSRCAHRPWVSPPTTPEEYAQLLARASDGSLVSLLPRRCEDGALVGYFNISEIVRGSFLSAYMGYGAVADFSGQGYMTEALGLVLDHAFGPLGLHRIEANIQPGNAPSIALVRRCGFEREGYSKRYLKIGGCWRDHERWAIRSELWQAHKVGTGDQATLALSPATESGPPAVGGRAEPRRA
jgi:ribosomal-protein-alanine N-acetyltransferase